MALNIVAPPLSFSVVPNCAVNFFIIILPPQVSNSNVTVLGKGPETLQNMVLISCLYIDSLFLKVWLYG